MHVRFHKHFVKKYEKLKKIQEKINDKIRLFSEDPFNSLLENHALRGEFKDCRSINITGDYKAVYKLASPNVALFIKIGTHSELYS